MKKLTLILLSILMIVILAACGNKCEHSYDNDCDATCNDCEETREVSVHQWKDATCTTLKTCTVCDYTCDNPGCQVTVGNPPKDKNPGIDLPIDTN